MTVYFSGSNSGGGSSITPTLYEVGTLNGGESFLISGVDIKDSKTFVSAYATKIGATGQSATLSDPFSSVSNFNIKNNKGSITTFSYQRMSGFTGKFDAPVTGSDIVNYSTLFLDNTTRVKVISIVGDGTADGSVEVDSDISIDVYDLTGVENLTISSTFGLSSSGGNYVSGIGAWAILNTNIDFDFTKIKNFNSLSTGWGTIPSSNVEFRACFSIDGGTSWLTCDGTQWLVMNPENETDWLTKGLIVNSANWTCSDGSLLNSTLLNLVDVEESTGFRYALYIKSSVNQNVMIGSAFLYYDEVDKIQDFIANSFLTGSYGGATKINLSDESGNLRVQNVTSTDTIQDIFVKVLKIS